MGWSPSLVSRPSTVRTSRPFACTAKTVQDLAGVPSSSTVQAPQLVVSQPMWVPVRPTVSRRKCASSIRGSTSAERGSPFTVTSTRRVIGLVCAASGAVVSTWAILPSLLCVPCRRPQASLREDPDDVALVVGGAAEVAPGLRVLGGQTRRLADGVVIQLRAGERLLGLGRPRVLRADPGKRDARPAHRAVRERHLHRHAHGCEVAHLALELQVGAGGLLPGVGHAYLGDHLVWLEGGRERA